MSSMRGIFFPGDGVLKIMDVPDPTPGNDEVVLEARAYGMCGSDLQPSAPAQGPREHGGRVHTKGAGNQRSGALRHRGRGGREPIVRYPSACAGLEGIARVDLAPSPA
ncbi:hypothetical protein [Marinivivus vitaminiproducens]|uniref:hypothetical protein n=1 Tax=Marinivivus vitaminiproducens TaxID=3035935 RepID=UPI00279C0FA3|nr:hypothetical protein P4R82_21910 [Geminicoccaceae bacterium SCSIO 64248]